MCPRKTFSVPFGHGMYMYLLYYVIYMRYISYVLRYYGITKLISPEILFGRAHEIRRRKPVFHGVATVSLALWGPSQFCKASCMFLQLRKQRLKSIPKIYMRSWDLNSVLHMDSGACCQHVPYFVESWVREIWVCAFMGENKNLMPTSGFQSFKYIF